MKDGQIYIVRNLINNKHYIGQTRNSFAARLLSHKIKPTYFGRALRKYGIEGFDVKIFPVPITDLSETERILIEEYDCVSPNGYNLQWGGDREYTVSEITRERMRQRRLGCFVSEETRKKMGDAHRGTKHPSGIPLSEEHKQKISQANTGKIISEKTKKKMSIAQKGKKHSFEHTEKIQKKRRRTYRITCPDGKVSIVKKLLDYCSKHKLSHGTLFLVAQGKRKHYKQYKARFMEKTL